MTTFMRHRYLLIAAAAAGAVLLGACSSDDEATPAATAVPAATISAETPAPTEAPPVESAYPVEVTDLLGRTVTIEAKPQAVVAISPTSVELVYAVGGTIVGRSSSVNYPAEATSAADIGSAFQPSVEAILALSPDLVIADSYLHANPNARGLMEGLGVPVIFAGADTISDVNAGLRLMGQVLDAGDEAEARVAEIEQAVVEAQALLATKNISVVALIADRDNTLYAPVRVSWLGDLFAALGVNNIAADLPPSGPFAGYTTLAPEVLIGANPNFILTLTPSPEPAPRLNTLIPQIPPFRGLAAVTGNKVIEIDLLLFLRAPGPRVLEGIGVLAETLAAE